MGSSGQLYSLSWGEFGNSLTSAVQLLRGHGDLVDVTLAAGGRSFPAHKIVLSAASPFLLDLLKSTPCQHPVVMLAGVSSDDLESLLEFVYRGEVSVEPSQLPSLLQAAHCLSIHGLTSPTVLTENGDQVTPPTIPEPSEHISREMMNSSIPNQRRRKRKKSSSSCSKWPRLDNTTDSDERLDDERTIDYDQKTEEPTPGDEDIQNRGKNVSDQPTTCPLCGAILRQSRNLRRHLELLHFPPGNSTNTGMRVRRRKTDFQSPTMVPRPTLHNFRMEHAQARSTDNPDLPASSLTSSLAGNLLSSSGNLLPSPPDQCFQSSELPSNTSSTIIPSSLNNSIYPTDSSTSMLSCLLSSLPSLPSLSTSHDVFRHSEILRAGMAYHDSTRQHARQFQGTDVL
ncbi:protein bric-a-brac 1-like isoform X3 [Diachasmimorpha longicaudata]|uniref:protein bric-a-brac 1-like isoform X3 n=1 Tax=Diachasmimorpha longicaudata TaxID=58733 RepID=UPI0030B89A6A